MKFKRKFGMFKNKDKVLITEFMVQSFEAEKCPHCGCKIYRWFKSGYGPLYKSNMDTGIHSIFYMCRECLEPWDHPMGYDGVEDWWSFIKYKIFRQKPLLMTWYEEKLKDRPDLLFRILEYTLWERLKNYLKNRFIKTQVKTN